MSLLPPLIPSKTNHGLIPNGFVKNIKGVSVIRWSRRSIWTGQTKRGESGAGGGVDLIENTGVDRHSFSADVMLFMQCEGAEGGTDGGREVWWEGGNGRGQRGGCYDDGGRCLLMLMS